MLESFVIFFILMSGVEADSQTCLWVGVLNQTMTLFRVSFKDCVRASFCKALSCFLAMLRNVFEHSFQWSETKFVTRTIQILQKRGETIIKWEKRIDSDCDGRTVMMKTMKLSREREREERWRISKKNHVVNFFFWQKANSSLERFVFCLAALYAPHFSAITQFSRQNNLRTPRRQTIFTNYSQPLFVSFFRSIWWHSATKQWRILARHDWF